MHVPNVHLPLFFSFQVPTIKTARFVPAMPMPDLQQLSLPSGSQETQVAGPRRGPVAGWYCGRNARVFCQGNLSLKINFLGGRKPNYPRWLPNIKFDVRFGVMTFGAPPQKKSRPSNSANLGLEIVPNSSSNWRPHLKLAGVCGFFPYICNERGKKCVFFALVIGEFCRFAH